MIACCVIILLVVQASLSQANDGDCTASQDIQVAIDKLSSRLTTVINALARSYDTSNSDVVSSSLLQLALLQQVISGHGDGGMEPPSSCNESVRNIMGKLDDIRSSVDASTQTVEESQETIDMLVEMVNSSRQTVESLTAIVTHLNTTVAQLQQQLDDHDKSSLILLNSCQEIKSVRPDLPSGYYTITSDETDGQHYTVYCNMEELCGSGDGWTRVAYLNMTDTDEQCPTTLQLYNESGVRVCGRQPTTGGCRTVDSFSSYDIDYKEICGRVIGYQYGNTDGFFYPSNNLNDIYMDGVSLTYGNPRTHIWSFTAGYHEVNVQCPCGGWNNLGRVPDVVGNHYYCESGTESVPSGTTLYTGDPLWDGEDCNGNESPCCAGQFTPPWFHRVLSTSTSDNIEMRTCFSGVNEDAPLELYEIYIK